MFIVKSAYHMAVAKFSCIHEDIPSTSTAPREWKKLWSVKVAPRVKIFMWRACTGALPTKVNLCQRVCQVDPICELCGGGGIDRPLADKMQTDATYVVWLGTQVEPK